MLKQILVSGLAACLVFSSFSAPSLARAEAATTTHNNIDYAAQKLSFEKLSEEEQQRMREECDAEVAKSFEKHRLMEQTEETTVATEALPIKIVHNEDNFFSKMSDGEIDLWFNEHYKNLEPHNTFEVSAITGDGKKPTSFFDLAADDYTGAGSYGSTFLYSSYYSGANSEHNLHISGTASRDHSTSRDLTMQIISLSGTASEVNIPVERQGTDTSSYAYDFFIGPLETNGQFYIRFDPADAVSRTTVNFTVSH